MNLLKFSGSKVFVLVQLLLCLNWLTWLTETDAYFFVYALVAFAGIYSLCDNYGKGNSLSGSRKAVVVIIAAVMSLLVVLANYALFEPLMAIQNLVGIGWCLLGGFFLWYHILLWAVRNLPLVSERKQKRRLSPCRVFWISMGLIFCIDLTFLLLVEFPGILTLDSLNQLEQILTGSYNNRHPYWHTRTMELFIRLGQLVSGDLRGGIASFCVFQILFMASCYSYVVMTLYQKRFPNWCVAGVWLVYALTPYHIAYGATLWKDVLFSGASLLMTTALYRQLCPEGTGKKRDMCLFVLGSLGLCLWRTNGMLVYLILIPVLALAFPDKKRTGIMAAILGLCLLLNGPLLSARGIEGSDMVEALSVPLQQVARVVREEKPLSAQDAALIAAIAEPEEIARAYSSEISDPIKTLVRSTGGMSVIQENSWEYAGLWLRLGIQYPGEYLKAWVDQTKGYWNGGYAYWITASGIRENAFGLVSATEGSLAAKLWYLAVRYLELTFFMQPLFSIGLHSWILVLSCVVNRVKNRKVWILSLPGISVLFGLLIGTPVYSEFRYAYPVILACPLLLAVTVFHTEPQQP